MIKSLQFYLEGVLSRSRSKVCRILFENLRPIWEKSISLYKLSMIMHAFVVL